MPSETTAVEPAIDPTMIFAVAKDALTKMLVSAIRLPSWSGVDTLSPDYRATPGAATFPLPRHWQANRSIFACYFPLLFAIIGYGPDQTAERGPRFYRGLCRTERLQPQL